MFLYSIWDEICHELSKVKKTIRVDEILQEDNNSEWLVIKHDVEIDVGKALLMAQIEAKYDIKATYFVQADLLHSGMKALHEIQQLGHEVTYHYDVLDANDGNYVMAMNEFSENIKKFNALGFEVKTVCPHGNPMINRNGWTSNKDFFRDQNTAVKFAGILDMVVQLPKRLNNNYIYISDAGYSWKQITNIEDNDIKNNGDIDLENYKNLLKTIKRHKRVILSTHPHRWDKSRMRSFIKLYRFKTLRFLAKKFSSVRFMKNIMSRFYYLAKKV